MHHADAPCLCNVYTNSDLTTCIYFQQCLPQACGEIASGGTCPVTAAITPVLSGHRGIYEQIHAANGGPDRLQPGRSPAPGRRGRVPGPRPASGLSTIQEHGTPPGGNGGSNGNFRHLDLAEMLDAYAGPEGDDLDSLLEAGLSAFMHSGNTGAVGKALGSVLDLTASGPSAENKQPFHAPDSPATPDNAATASRSSPLSPNDASAAEQHHLLLLQSGVDMS